MEIKNDKYARHLFDRGSDSPALLEGFFLHGNDLQFMKTIID